METNLDNSFAKNSWTLVQKYVEQLNELKSDASSVHEMLATVKRLDNLLHQCVTDPYRTVNTPSTSKITVILPQIYSDITTVAEAIPQTETIAEEQPADTDQNPIPPIITIPNSSTESDTTTKEAGVDSSIEKIQEAEAIPETVESEPVLSNETETAPTQELELPKESPIIEEKEPEAENTISASSDTVYVSQPSQPEIPTETIVPKEDNIPSPKRQFSLWETFSSNDIPTLAHQNIVQDTPSPSAESTQEEDANSYEEMSKLPHIKDLKKAISINDRYLFINELFRGDESMYDRCLKTINNFNIYQEAKYWIDRELKLKMGWDDSHAAVKQFNSLVKRRFA